MEPHYYKTCKKENMHNFYNAIPLSSGNKVILAKNVTPLDRRYYTPWVKKYGTKLLYISSPDIDWLYFFSLSDSAENLQERGD